MDKDTVVVPDVPVGSPRVSGSDGVVTKFEPMVFPVAHNAVGPS